MQVSTMANAIFVFPSSNTKLRTYKRSASLSALPSRNPPAMMRGKSAGEMSVVATPTRNASAALAQQAKAQRIRAAWRHLMTLYISNSFGLNNAHALRTLYHATIRGELRVTTFECRIHVSSWHRQAHAKVRRLGAALDYYDGLASHCFKCQQIG